ncbi:hypothetical protein OUZ56_019462 [Daphnia magna]|uniref:Uncharacterized protein n=1 Tax=Daphnia magna TaxID=35525 RepID=A0ABQ9ZBN9_9CRUS|nr:hypothetical protein OUZ56_019462 [Daphnia magna]
MDPHSTHTEREKLYLANFRITGAYERTQLLDDVQEDVLLFGSHPKREELNPPEKRKEEAMDP